MNKSAREMAGPVFSTSLIREKIVISDEDAMLGDKDAKVILSNRISLPSVMKPSSCVARTCIAPCAMPAAWYVKSAVPAR